MFNLIYSTLHSFFQELTCVDEMYYNAREGTLKLVINHYTVFVHECRGQVVIHATTPYGKYGGLVLGKVDLADPQCFEKIEDWMIQLKLKSQQLC